jgi:hypothetical protein
MPSLHFFAGWTSSGCLLGCNHQHETIISAVGCCSPAGAYVVAVENGECRQLNEAEELQFQHAMYGYDTGQDGLLSATVALLAFLSHFARYHG